MDAEGGFRNLLIFEGGNCGAGDRKNYKANITTFFLFQVLANTDELFSVVETKNSSKAILHASQACGKVNVK